MDGNFWPTALLHTFTQTSNMVLTGLVSASARVGRYGPICCPTDQFGGFRPTDSGAQYLRIRLVIGL